MFACAGRGHVSALQWLLLQNLVGIAGDVFENVFNPAVQDSAQVIERCGCDGFVVAQLVDGGAGKPMVFDQRIG